MPLTEIEKDAVDRHSLISPMYVSGIASALREARMKSQRTQSKAFLRSTFNMPLGERDYVL